MDPDVCLQKIRELIVELRGSSKISTTEACADEISEHFEALDEWISKGGFMPADWARAQFS